MSDFEVSFYGRGGCLVLVILVCGLFVFGAVCQSIGWVTVSIR